MLMKLKRIFAGIMSAAIALSLFGCASTTETADTQGESGTRSLDLISIWRTPCVKNLGFRRRSSL